jgi:hypothetical protein
VTAPAVRKRAGQGRAEQAGAAEPSPADDADVLASPHPDWLYHRLEVAGDADLVTLFRHAARGPGAIPWADDLGPAEEDWFHLLLAAPPEGQKRAISLQGARILAGQLRDAVERRREMASVRAGRGGSSGGECPGACPLDLHRLVPVPGEVLRLGPGHPRTRRWLWARWGTTWPLRHVVEQPAPKAGQRPVREPGRLRLGFWSADWTPWPAIARLRRDWPALRFDVRPRYDAG